MLLPDPVGGGVLSSHTSPPMLAPHREMSPLPFFFSIPPPPTVPPFMVTVPDSSQIIDPTEPDTCRSPELVSSTDGAVAPEAIDTVVPGEFTDLSVP